ncbi:MAG TPA: hypothetical protein VN516_06270 [Candidatus Baltobacteraceae bacterium]|nr:hypothetical protein [Candidatus Baltobacteraceae bacterium]
MEEQELKQIRLEVTQLRQTVNAQASMLILLLGVAKTGISPHRANISEEIDKLQLHPSVVSLKNEAKKIIPLYFP